MSRGRRRRFGLKSGSRPLQPIAPPRRMIVREATGHLKGVVLGVAFPAPDRAVTINRIEFAKPRATSGFMGRDQRRARAAKQVQDKSATSGDVANGVRNHRHRLDGRMERQFLAAPGFPGVDPL